MSLQLWADTVIGQQTMADLLAAFTWADQQPEVQVIVLTGVGRFFSAGMDLVGLPNDGPVLSDFGVDQLS